VRRLRDHRRVVLIVYLTVDKVRIRYAGGALPDTLVVLASASRPPARIRGQAVAPGDSH
jgi:hypothetical protein